MRPDRGDGARDEIAGWRADAPAPALPPVQTARVSGSAPTLTDSVVVLDGHTLDDLAAHLAGEDEEQARRMGWYPASSTVETVGAAILRWQEEWRRGGATRAFAVREAATGGLVGQCEIRLKDAEIGEMSYVVFPAYRGRGFATRAVRLACDFALAELGVERMELYIEPDKLPSRAVARNAGFVEEGVLRNQGEVGDAGRDMLICSRLPSD